MISLLWIWSLASALVWLAWCSLRAELAADARHDGDADGEKDPEHGPPVAFMAEKQGPRRHQRRRGSTPLTKERAAQLLFGRRYTYQSVWRWLGRLGVPRGERRDLAQEVLEKAWRSWDTYDPMRSRPERWLNRITVHIAAHFNAEARHYREVLVAEPVDVKVPDPTPVVSEVIEHEQTRVSVLDALDALPSDLRSILIAHDIDGIPMKEIAALHGMPLSTAYKWRARALDALAEELDRREREAEERMEGRCVS